MVGCSLGSQGAAGAQSTQSQTHYQWHNKRKRGKVRSWATFPPPISPLPSSLPPSHCWSTLVVGGGKLIRVRGKNDNVSRNGHQNEKQRGWIVAGGSSESDRADEREMRQGLPPCSFFPFFVVSFPFRRNNQFLLSLSRNCKESWRFCWAMSGRFPLSPIIAISQHPSGMRMSYHCNHRFESPSLPCSYPFPFPLLSLMWTREAWRLCSVRGFSRSHKWSQGATGSEWGRLRVNE